MKTNKRNFLKGFLAIPLLKIIDVEGSKNKQIAKKEQENIKKFYNAINKDGHIYSGWNFVPEEHEGSKLVYEVDVTQSPSFL